MWYCSRECQVEDWKKHKEACNKLAKELREAEERKKNKEEEVVV